MLMRNKTTPLTFFSTGDDFTLVEDINEEFEMDRQLSTIKLTDLARVN